MPRIQAHGGGCCGVRHIAGFSASWLHPRPTKEMIQDEVKIFPPSSGGRTRGKVVEAVITDSQFRQQPELAQIMKDEGFRLVTRFHNSTGGMCNVLHRVGGGRDFSRGRQPEWVRILRSSN